MLTQGASVSSQYFAAPNLSVTPAVGDVLRVHALIALSPSVAGSMQLRTRGNNLAAPAFTYDATGTITGFTESWATYRQGYYNLGAINGKNWAYVWFDAKATSTTASYPGIAFTTLDAGMKMHLCELMIQKNPLSTPAAVPVCAQAMTFAADTINTGIGQNVGYVMPYVATARSQAPQGRIAVPQMPAGLPYLPIEKEIRVVHSTETADISGLLHNANEAYAIVPWGTGTGANPTLPWTVTLGPGAFPTPITFASGKGASVYTLRPVFRQRPELAPRVRKITGNATYVGSLVADGCVFQGWVDARTSFWEQTDISSTNTGMQYLEAAGSVSAKGSLFVGCPLTHTRAAYQVQDDDSDEMRTFCGENTFRVNAGAIDVTGSDFRRIGRGSQFAAAPGSACALTASDLYFDLVWSDNLYINAGDFDGAVMNNLFLGRFVAKDQMLWQTQKEIEVDLLDGNGWQALSNAGLAQTDLPVGKRASHFGTYDVDTGAITEAPDPTLSMMVRRFTFSSGTATDKPGYQFHADQVVTAGRTATRYPDLNSVWVISSDTMRVRMVVQGGHWSNASTYVADTSGNPAVTASGTHADNFQINSSQVSFTNLNSDGALVLNDGQGPFQYGSTQTAIGTLNYSNWVIVTAAINGFAFGNGNSTTACTGNLTNVLLIQREAEFRLTNGGAEQTKFVTSGSLTSVNLNNVYALSTHSAGYNFDSVGSVSGAVTLIPAPSVADYDTLNATTACPNIANMIPGDLLDPVWGTVRSDIDPRDFRFTAYGESRTGVKVNAIVEAAIGDHPRWDAVMDEIIRVYHKTPDIRLTIPSSTAAGTVFSLQGKVKASSFHPTHGNHRLGYFTLDGAGNLVVAKALTGIDDLRLLRTALDETILIDVTA